MRAKPKGAKYQNLTLRGDLVYYERVAEWHVHAPCPRDESAADLGPGIAAAWTARR